MNHIRIEDLKPGTRVQVTKEPQNEWTASMMQYAGKAMTVLSVNHATIVFEEAPGYGWHIHSIAEIIEP